MAAETGGLSRRARIRGAMKRTPQSNSKKTGGRGGADRRGRRRLGRVGVDGINTDAAGYEQGDWSWRPKGIHSRKGMIIERVSSVKIGLLGGGRGGSERLVRRMNTARHVDAACQRLVE